MNIEEFRDFCLSIKGATECFPFDENALVFKVMDKMFAYGSIAPKDGRFRFSMKCDPERGSELREQYEGIIRGEHTTSTMWNGVYLDSDLPDTLIKELVEHSVDEVIKKLPQKQKEEYYNIIHIQDCDSTNNALAEINQVRQLKTGKGYEEGTIVWADFQSAGKGQRGNGWESDNKKNLLFSILLYPDMIKAGQQFILSQIVSLAVAECLSQYIEDITIKWPNDIYWKEKKICGILIENNLEGDLIKESVAGIGININQTKFTSDAPNPISLKQITGENYKLCDPLIDIRNSIFRYYKELQNGTSESIIKRYKEQLFRADGYHTYNDGTTDFMARIKDIEPNGLLVLETKDGKIKKFAFKEVKYVLNRD